MKNAFKFFAAVFAFAVLILTAAKTYDGAPEAIRTSPSNNENGIFAFSYVDETARGSYTLYLQVESVD